MSYRIDIQPEAQEEIESAYQWIAKDSTENARRWRIRLLERIETLSENPERCPLARESESQGKEIRELLFGKRRGVYRISFRHQGNDRPHPVCPPRLATLP